MSSTDLDRGGALRVWDKIYLGPTLGWIMFQVTNLIQITTGGITDVPFGTTLVTVNVASPVTVQLASSHPGNAIIASPITIVDIGGNAAANNITILPYGNELIMSLASIAIANDYGAFTLEPLSTGGWVQQ